MMVAPVLLVGCGLDVQTFSRYGISFEVSRELRLEEYTVSVKDQVFRRGTASYEEGAVLSDEKNFMLLWARTVPEFAPDEVRVAILSTPNSFGSAGGTFKAAVVGDLVEQEVAGFKVTSARMEFTMPGWRAPGITAVWYSPLSKRTMQVVLIHKQPETEMKRFIRSFSEEPPADGSEEEVSASTSIPQDWRSYDNESLGMSFRYPDTYALLLDDPINSGIQLKSDAAILMMSANPMSLRSIETLAGGLRSTGFRETDRVPIRKGSWTGLRLQGTVTGSDVHGREVVYMVETSSGSLFTFLAIATETST